MALGWQVIIYGIFGVIIGGIIMLATIICDRKKRVKKSTKEPALKIETSKTETPKKEAPKIEASKILAV